MEIKALLHRLTMIQRLSRRLCFSIRESNEVARERGRLKTLINNKGREKGWLNISVGIIRHLVTSMKYFPACGNNYKGVGIILRAW